MAADTLDSTQKEPGNLKRNVSNEEFVESPGSLKRTISNEEAQVDVHDVNSEMLPTPLRNRGVGRASSGLSRPIETFSGTKSSPGMVPTRTPSQAPQCLPSVSVRSESHEQHPTTDKPVRKATRVVPAGTRLSTKKDGGYSPLPATVSASSLTRSSSTANDLHLEDAEEDNKPFARLTDKKQIKMADTDKEHDTVLQRDDSFHGTSSSGNSTASESASTSASATAGSEGGEGGHTRKARKSLGWGDKRAPSLNYKPWYSVFIW